MLFKVHELTMTIFLCPVCLAQEDEPVPPPDLPTGACEIPDHFRGDFFSIEGGDHLDTVFGVDYMENLKFSGTCADRKDINNTIGFGRSTARGTHDSFIVFQNQ